MPSTYSDILRLEKQARGENPNTWGGKLNTQLDLIEDAIAGMVTITTTGGNSVLTTANGTEDQSRYAVLRVQGTLASNATIITPSKTKPYTVLNETTGAYLLTIKTATGAGSLCPQGVASSVFCDGLDVVNVSSASGGAVQRQQVTLTAGQTTINLNFAYQQGRNSLAVYRGGQKLVVVDDYAETTNSSITLVEAGVVGETVEIYGATADISQGISGGFGIILVNRFSGTGAQTAFTLSQAPAGVNGCQVYVSGAYQQKNTYDVSGVTLTFSEAPVAGTDNIEVVIYDTVNIGETTADLVSYQLAGGAVRDVAEKLGEFVSVKDFGAVGDGVTDDTAAIQAALNAGSVVDFGTKGHFKFSSTLDFTDKVVIGARRSTSAVSGADGVLLEFTGTSTATPAINFGGHFGIKGLTITRTGAGTRGVILNLASSAERNSYIKDCWLYGASYCIYGGTSSNFIYSTIFENIEFGNFNDTGLWLDCAGATGNVYTNLYFSNWLTYPLTKNTARAFIWLQGSHTEGVFNQINCEHSVISNSCILVNGLETATFNSVHVEGVEFNTQTQILRVIGTGTGAKINVNSLNAVFNKMLGNDVRAFYVESASSGSVELNISGFKSRDNNINGTSGHRFATRGGTITTNTPTIKATGVESDLFGGNNNLPIESTTFKPILEKFNSQTFYEQVGGVHYMPALASAPSSGVYPKNAIVMNSAVASTGDRGWHSYGRGSFAKPQSGNITVTQFNSAMAPDATAYAAFAIGDYIEVNSVVFLITNKYSGNTFTVSPTPSFTSGSYPCLLAAPQFRAIS